MLEWADDVVALADHLKIKKFSVMGVSGGGPYAAACGFKIPDRLHKVGIVVGLAPTWIPGLMDGAAWHAQFAWNNYGKFPFLRRFAALFQYVISIYSPGMGIHRFLWGAKTDRDIYASKQVRQLSQQNYREAFRQGYKGAELDLDLYTHDWGFELNKITVPTFLWYGADDKNVSVKMGEYYHQQIPGSKLIVYPGEGHLVSRTHVEEILHEFI